MEVIKEQMLGDSLPPSSYVKAQPPVGCSLEMGPWEVIRVRLWGRGS